MTNTEAQAVLGNMLMRHDLTDAELEAIGMAGEALEGRMTIKEKGELVTYINYLRAKGEESRRTSRKDGIADYFRAYCSGSGARALDVADELDRFLESVEVET